MNGGNRENTRIFEFCRGQCELPSPIKLYKQQNHKCLFSESERVRPVVYPITLKFDPFKNTPRRAHTTTFDRFMKIVFNFSFVKLFSIEEKQDRLGLLSSIGFDDALTIRVLSKLKSNLERLLTFYQRDIYQIHGKICMKIPIYIHTLF